MAVLDYLGQVPAQWFDASGAAALSGGKLAFYEVGTTTPKAVYADYQGNTSAGTTVTLDSSGRANIWLSGIYSVQLLTAADVPIGNRVDGIGRELAPQVDASAVLSVETYDDLRALTGADVRICGVEGRDANGDGGAGLFAWDDAETATDDGGTILTPTTLPASGRWVRIFSGDMDFRWFGDITGTDDTTAYALGLAASVARKRWLSITNGTVRLTSTVSASAGSMVRIPLGGKIVAASSLVSVGFPAGTLFEGSPGCFGENISVSFGLNAVPAVDVTWWDVATDDTRLAEAGDACADANMEVLIPRAMALTSSYSQPANAVLNFQGPGKLAWSGAGAVSVTLRRWKTDANEFPRFTFSSVAKLAALTMVESQNVHLSPRMFGGGGTGSGDDAAAVWATFLHGWVKVDGKFPVGTSLTKAGSVRIRGDLSAARDLATSSDIPHGIALGSGINLETTADLVVEGTGIYALNAAQSSITVGGRFALSNGFLWGQDNTGVASLGLTSLGNEITNSQTTCVPVHGGGILRDSDVYGSATFNVSAVPQIGIGASGWEIERSYIEETAAFGALRIDASEIEAADSIAWAAGAIVTASTVAPAGANSYGVTSGDFQIIGGRVTLPLHGDDAHNITLDSFQASTMPWNGFGSMTISGGNETVKNGGITDTNAIRRGANILDGVAGPRNRLAALDGAESPTSSTSNWAFGGGATPTVSTDTFSWASGIAAAGTTTIVKTVIMDAEKILMAYGGYVVAEWIGDVDSITFLGGAESIAVATCPGTSAQRAVYHVWPGVPTGTTGYSFRIVHGGGAVTLKVTIQPCAPVNAAQWEMFWGGDRTLSASRLNTWKETLTSASDCIALDTWASDLGTYNTYSPRPETSQPWLVTLPIPVKIWPVVQTLPSIGIVGHTLFAFKPTSGTAFRIFNCGGS